MTGVQTCAHPISDDPTTELWIDTTTDPPTMKANVNGAWVEIGAPVTGPAPLDEVWVGPVDPRDASTELWYDVDAVPSNLGRTVPASLVDGLITEVSNLKSRLAVLEAYVMNGVSV